MFQKRAITALVLGCCWLLPAANAGAQPATGEAPAAAPAAQVETPAAGDSKAPAAELSIEQEQVAERYRRFEELLLRMAELTAAEDPSRAALLRQTVAKSKERLVGMQFEKIIEMLGADKLTIAVNGQGDITKDLQTLLDLLLSEDRSERLKTEQERLRAYLKEVNKLIKDQQGVEAQTRRGGQTDPLAERQSKLAERTDKLGQQMRNDEAEARGESPDKKSDEASDAKSADGKNPDEQPADGKSDGKSADDKPEGDRGAESKPSDGDKSGEKSGEGRPSDGEKPDSGKSEQGDSKSGEPGKPGEGDPSKPSDASGKPGESGDSEPGQSQPGESQPGSPNPGGDSSESESGEQQLPPAENDAQRRVAVAQQRMKDAQEKLEKALREEAVEKQEEALRELEAAKAELEKILRQMREEEMARILALLEARFRKMLEQQVEVYEGTIRLDRLPAADRGRSSEIEASRLSRSESLIVIEADKALALLHEEGSAVAMAEALEQTRDDMQQVTSKLAEFDVGALTQGIEEDIIASLEEMIAALEKAQQEMESQQSQQQPQPPGEPQEPPLVDQLAELRMIRSLQMRVNRRTQTYTKLINGEQADKPELIEAIKDLAKRQDRIYRTTRDIVVGKNE